MDRYYDLVLALIPVALFGLGGSLFVAGIGLQVAVSVAGLTAVALIAHALFVNGPGSNSGRRSEAPQTASDSGVGTGPMNAD